jgi:positive regulator of sigma E activity
MNRKEFLKTGGRILILGAMAATTGYLVVNQKVDATCSVSSACQKCGQFAKCELPQAIETKKNEHPKGITP